MPRSLSLAAYLAYARRTTSGTYAPKADRPEGPLLWAHASDQAHVDALLQLFDRIRAQRSNMHLLLTTRDAGGDSKTASRRAVLHEQVPADSLPVAARFLDHWRPDFVLWTGGDLHAALIHLTAERDLPLVLIDIEESALSRPAWRWFPDLPRALLRLFDVIMTRDESTLRFIRRLGVTEENSLVTGPFLDGTTSLPCHEAAREEMAAMLLGRPVWLAAMLQEDEIASILDAHRQVSRRSLRALLIVVPRDIGKADIFRQALRRSGLRFVTWSEGELPEETTQVILADTTGEMGLWYRLAPISFMGSSLRPGATGSDPNEPAAHGSAILYGPSIRRYLTSYTRFAEAGAARIVRDAETLANAVSRLIPPDETAAMAHAAWEVASRSAALTDRVAELVNDQLDRREAT
ncbi:3-deoxy-D-manno-octulosonic acid transferase [Roseovarius aestuariivivens]|uniref:3-deoxy-D-manno-octulosonic acid transferase n=1 Tax=Roseovarius aestuariivivens TaxID=1888910 RepID=UPI00107FE7DD|nr:glycosyltransferase N-terminal domain-containing protein [Roseovarius aestuariivivens]